MRGDREQMRLALQVGIALTAGMFSIMPVAYGAPVGGDVKSGPAKISDFNTSTKILDIKPPDKTDGTPVKGTNNVIDWQDFSVAKGETVRFDGGEHNNNYMNIVSGHNTSDINGTIVGGKDVYIINPNGVIFGKSLCFYALCQHRCCYCCCWYRDGIIQGIGGYVCWCCCGYCQYGQY